MPNKKPLTLWEIEKISQLKADSIMNIRWKKNPVTLDLEDVPVGSIVSTPTGRVGIVVKHHTTSRVDVFNRVDVRFSKNPRDGVLLQPHFLNVIEFCQSENVSWNDLLAKIAALGLL